MKNLQYLFILILSNLLCSCNGQDTKIQTIDPQLFAQKTQNTTTTQLIDVRTPQEYALQHIDKSQNIDYNSPDFEVQINKLDKTKPVYLYCLSGGRSAKAATKLSTLGFTQIYNLSGGILNWNSQGFAKDNNTTAASHDNTGMTIDDFNTLLNTDKKVLIDFYAQWCGPCKKMAPYLQKMQTQMQDKITIIKIDIDKNPTLVQALKITAVPTLLLYKNKKMVYKNEGYISEQDLKNKL